MKEELCKMDAEEKNEATCIEEGDVAGEERRGKRDKLALLYQPQSYPDTTDS